MASESPVRLAEADQVKPHLAETSEDTAVFPYKENLLACYNLLKESHSTEIGVDDFCRTLLAGSEGQCSGSAFLTALLETFRVESRAGRSYIVLSPLKEECRPAAGTRVKLDRRPPRSSKRAFACPPNYRCLVDRSHQKVRVTQCEREEGYLKIHFHLKRDEAKMTSLMTRLNIIDLGEKPVHSFKGLYCAAPIDEGLNEGVKYARAIVMKPAGKKDREVKVRFLDFGFVDYVEKTALRRLPAGFWKTRPLAYTGLVVNTRLNDPVERQKQAIKMLENEETLLRVLKFNKEKRFHEVYAYKPSQRPDAEELGFQRG